jgi:AcrR family transcriptional regulator
VPEDAAVRWVLGRRDRKRLETRKGLAAVALELFAERGFDAVTVNDIADRADVDPSTFYRHFGSKEAVVFSDLGDWTRPAGIPPGTQWSADTRYTSEHLRAVEDELNGRPRRVLGDRSPAELFTALLASLDHQTLRR